MRRVTETDPVKALLAGKIAEPLSVSGGVRNRWCDGMNSRRGHQNQARGWLVAVGLGLMAGYWVGVGMMGTYTHAAWPALAGLILGIACSLAAPRRPLLISFCGSSIAVGVAVAKVALTQVHRGHWPITDQAILAHYGTATEATLRAAVILGVLMGIPCLLTTAMVSLVKQRRAYKRTSNNKRPTDALTDLGEP
ncbi:MAG: hypothetical protein DWQ01_09960 [Planctomycetota bacterium]|nr:MAG: hypothetical protein DWQ01_09960 [Planctomycetota bacterium]